MMLTAACVSAAMWILAPRVPDEAGQRVDMPVRYEVDVSRAPQQLLGVTMTLSDVPADLPGGVLDVHLPVWRPGLYVLVEQAGTVRDVTAQAGDGAPVRVEKIEKATWRLHTGASGGQVKLWYTVYAAALENRTRHADSSHVFMSPSTVMMYAPAWRSRPVEVSITVPGALVEEGWKLATGLPSEAVPGGWTVKARDYDRLVDSPIEVGLHDARTFDVAGVPHEVVVWTGVKPEARTAAGVLGSLEKYKGFPEVLSKIVEAQRQIFLGGAGAGAGAGGGGSGLPYDRYVFLIHAYPGGRGGTEHWNSTVMQTAPEAFLTERYDSFLSLVAHEMFHTWNVKRFRPVGLTPYDYQRENYTDLLWLVEGTTTYYEGVTLARAGLIKHDRVFETLAAEIDRDRTAPGARVQSAAASSFDAWISGSKLGADQINSTVSIYGKGMLVSFYLDMWIRERNPDAGGLDAVMRGLMRMAENGKAYTTADVKRLVAEASGAGVDEVEAFFAKAIEGTALIDAAAALAVVGLQAVDDEKQEGTLGLTSSETAGVVTVSAVIAGSPGSKAGLLPGDVLVAVDGVRVRNDGDKMVARRSGERVRVSYFRNDTMREVEVEVGSKPAGKLKVKSVKEPTEVQRAQREMWIGKGS